MRAFSATDEQQHTHIGDNAPRPRGRLLRLLRPLPRACTSSSSAAVLPAAALLASRRVRPVRSEIIRIRVRQVSPARAAAPARPSRLARPVHVRLRLLVKLRIVVVRVAPPRTLLAPRARHSLRGRHVPRSRALSLQRRTDAAPHLRAARSALSAQRPLRFWHRANLGFQRAWRERAFSAAIYSSSAFSNASTLPYSAVQIASNPGSYERERDAHERGR